MDLTLTTPALLFPTVSLLLLAYTNRFLAIATLIRGLSTKYKDNPSATLLLQINNLRTRLRLIRDMQFLGIMCLFLCVLCMFLLFQGEETLGKWVFGISLILLMTSLGISAREIQISTRALAVELRDLEEVK